MAAISLRAAGLVALLATALYQTLLRDTITKFGFGRTVQPMTDFPYQCRRLGHEQLQACEDMWLDEENRHLYLTCSNVASRQSWLPNVGKHNETAVYSDEAVYVLDIDKPVRDSYQLRRLTTTHFYGTAGEGNLHALSLSMRKIPGSKTIELYFVNNRPSLSNWNTGELADNKQTGHNATIELFEHTPGSTSMQHVRTFASPLIVNPNNIAPISDGSGFYITNDHGLARTGIKYALSPFLFSGNVVHCTNPPRGSASTPMCKIVASGLSFPNGLVIHPADPKTLYVPSAAIGKGITIYKIKHDGSLDKLHDLVVPYAIDNLNPSGDGSIYAACFPKVLETLKHFEDRNTFDPTIAVAARRPPPSGVLKISKLRNLVDDGHEVTWTWEKVMEDAAGLVLPGSTVAVRDSKTGNLFMSGE